MATKFYDTPEEDLQAMIAASQKGDSKAQKELLKIFDNLLWKYAQLLHNGKYSIFDSSDTRAFLSLYVKDASIRYPLLKNKLNSSQLREINKIVGHLRTMTQRYGDIEDTMQTIRMAFLHSIQNYKRTPSKQKPGEYVPFAGYISFYFKFTVKKFVDEFLLDQNGLHTFRLKDDSSNWTNGFDMEEESEGLEAPPTLPLEEMMVADTIDEYWVVGDTAKYPFTILTSQERQLIRWRYYDKLKSAEIANKITEHPNTLREHFNRIRYKLAQEME